eukprot:2295741-Pyramimonas_sp.AAC.1
MVLLRAYSVRVEPYLDDAEAEHGRLFGARLAHQAELLVQVALVAVRLVLCDAIQRCSHPRPHVRPPQPLHVLHQQRRACAGIHT